ncbi:hypothetical protein [Thiothrix unzii]|uniref:Uncharacterized protein n=1 Tax=Thiothrix unzii TaxID=111769 RepID=A0A975IHY3_9GAMM|nr:hypothetical protein [Thiothrix unzii]QTR54123.1 hypothetical protein J9260_03240 [Thiothrix unzii]
MKNLIIILLSLFSQSVLADGSALAPLFTINSNGDVNLGPKKEPREFDAYKESYVEVHHIEMEITRNIKDTPPAR